MNKEAPQLLIADTQGRIYNLPHLEATGMKGGHFFRLRKDELIKLPSGSEIFMLPVRAPVGYDPQRKNFVVLSKNPLTKKNEPCFAVASFVSPGYTVSYSSSYRQTKDAKILPLFSYAAVCFFKGAFYVAAIRVEREKRQDLRLMDISLVKKNVAKFKKIFSHNRLIRYLQRCALVYGCPAAKNFFLQRYEAPLPTSPFCNARCIGCISSQPQRRCPPTQPRIRFIPHPEEIAEVALFHLEHVPEPLVSFGQGCEGEPLLVAEVLAKSIRLIRKKTARGIININTNASKPKILAKLFDAGLDSMRVSLNSTREKYYTMYFQPKAYKFSDVCRSIKIAQQKGVFVAINYLTMPGFTDSIDEVTALKNFIEDLRIDMIQWRNLNFDPCQYFRDLKVSEDTFKMLGIREVISLIRQNFPHLLMGYFNPARQKIKRYLKDKEQAR